MGDACVYSLSLNALSAFQERAMQYRCAGRFGCRRVPNLLVRVCYENATSAFDGCKVLSSAMSFELVSVGRQLALCSLPW